MNQKQLNPHLNQDFFCDSCQKEFRQTTAYSPKLGPGFLTETYCEDCVKTAEEKPPTCSFRWVDDKIKQYVSCDKPVFDKKKQLCRSHNRQVWKRFNEFTKEMSVSGTASWYEVWNQSGDWRYFWNLEETKAAESKQAKANNHWNKIKQKSLGEVPQEASRNLQAPELAPSDKRITGRTKQLNLKVQEQTYWKLKEFALKEKCLMTEILEKALAAYEKHRKN